MAVANARLDMNSDIAALYIESLNDIMNQQASRIVKGAQVRIPAAICVLLLLLIILGMFATGYESYEIYAAVGVCPAWAGCFIHQQQK